MKRIISGPEAIVEASETLKNGGVVIFPTETVYGIGALPSMENALKRIFEIKKRPPDKPLQILISDIEQVDAFAEEVSHAAAELMKKNWPGPMTLVFKKKKGISDIITANGPTIGLRMPDDRFILDLLKITGPIAATSANISGQPDPTLAGEVKIEADLLLDGGRCKTGQASTVIDVSTDPPLILRQGAVKIK